MSPIHNIQQLVALTGVEIRTLRHWIHVGLVPKPLGRGRGARYTDDHVGRVRAVQQLRTQVRSLRAVRARLDALSAEQLAALAQPPRATTPEGVPVAPPLPTYPHRAFQYVALMPGLGLWIDEQGGELLRRIAGDIYRHYAMPAPPPTLG